MEFAAFFSPEVLTQIMTDVVKLFLAFLPWVFIFTIVRFLFAPFSLK